MVYITALELPEISAVVGSYLPLGSLSRCTLVCRAWRRRFLPDLWRNFGTQNYFGGRNKPPPALSVKVLAALEKHASLVRQLHIQEYFLVQLQSIYLPNLQSLSVAPYFAALDQQEAQTALEDLIERHDRLQILGIENRNTLRMQIVWDIETRRKTASDGDERFQEQQQLRTLSVHDHVLDAQELCMNKNAGWDLLRGLETLSLTRTKWTLTKDDSVSLSSLLLRDHFSHLRNNRIQSLSLIDCQPQSTDLDFQIITHCQQLRSLTWHQRGFDDWQDESLDLVSGMAKGLAERLWPYLDTIELCLKNAKDDQYAEVIENLGRHSPLRSLTMSKTTFGPKSAQALLYGQGGRHRASLEKLYIRYCRSVTGAMVHQVLCSFTKLTTLQAPFITELDVLQDPKPWVCLGMKDLKVCLYVPILGADMDLNTITVVDPTVPVTSKSLPPVVPRPSTALLDRIATLTRLELLNVACRDTVVPPRAPLTVQHRRPTDCWTVPPIQLDNDEGTVSDHFSGYSGSLTRLGSLKRLREFIPTSTGHCWTMREAQWMVENWPQLVSLECSPLLDNQMTSEEVSLFLEQHGVEDNYDFLFD
ncbi:hypothetical protein EMPS_03776 [Entomortierella parvispora]|uniref:F-box domain-containing protein n=1 Tax=Entomortierella parvispora TaxID=205924 RepID=A0A9P3LUR4_9FUNG|nr:hypothetical protein EMPS_03776 [Entomortierella parvispora]